MSFTKAPIYPTHMHQGTFHTPKICRPSLEVPVFLSAVAQIAFSAISRENFWEGTEMSRGNTRYARFRPNWAHICLLSVLSLCPSCSSLAATPSTASTSALISDREAQVNTDSHVKISVAGIAEADSLKLRLDRAQRLSERVNKHPDEVSLTDVDALASLLSAPDDGVRFWIAGTLGTLGVRANSAVPQLQTALQQRPCEKTPMNSASAIRLRMPLPYGLFAGNG